ncbi:MAG: D-alanyl-D-alanine carboxypeptidase [Syntrophales bacterium]|nr:D-alanyl-D-alanine carboxypeptidase [Syntrophales bacterium]
MKRWAFYLVITLLITSGVPDAWGKREIRREKCTKHHKAKTHSSPSIKSAIVADMETGTILYSKNPDKPIPPASLTKIMTLYLVFESLESGKIKGSDLVHVSQRAANTKGTRMNLRAHDLVTINDLIKGIAIASANDGATAIAEHLSGSVENFVSLMNEKAKQLGMLNTCFRNSNGLPAKGQVTTAKDLLILSRAYLKRFPNSLHIHSIKYFTYAGVRLRNRNRLLGTYPGADGIKTGYVAKAGYNISATAKRGNVRIIAVVMGASDPWVRVKETTRLLDLGFLRMNGKGA